MIITKVCGIYYASQRSRYGGGYIKAGKTRAEAIKAVLKLVLQYERN